MREVIAATFVSLDGVMQAPGGPQEDADGGFEFGGWTFHYWDGAMGAEMDEQFGAPFDLLLGRKTYDIFAAHWPRTKGDPIGEKFGAVTKYVASRGRPKLDWENSVHLPGEAADAVARLKREDGPALLIQGSGELIQSLLARDLIDEFRLMIFPLTLGGGKRLFADGAQPAAMKLVDSLISSTGVVLLKYRRDGAVRTGSFALPDAEAVP